MNFESKKTLSKNRKSMNSESDLPKPKRGREREILSSIELSDETDTEDDLITLHACGQTTHWRFPKNLKQCPVKSCLLQFGIRSDAIDHYKKRHANNAILCPSCDRPLLCSNRTLANLMRHYVRIHPNEKLPYNLSLNIKPEAKTNVRKDANTDSETERDDDEEDDLITLNECGQSTYWRFPQNQKRCPVKSCLLQFGVRSDAINHYRKQHANHAILCPICDKPIMCANQKLTNFMLHFKKIHPKEKLPYNLSTKTKPKAETNNKSTDSEIDDGEDDDEEDDLITLHGCDQTTYWRFPPNLKRCPISYCLTEFVVRSDAINHYRKQHANHAILCPICVKPIMSKQGSSDFKAHYKKIHPREELPYNLNGNIEPEAKTNVRKDTNTDSETEQDDDEEDDLIILHGCGITTEWRFPPNLKRCPFRTCLIQFGVRSDVIDHYRKRHVDHAILCPICVKPIMCGDRDISNLKQHYRSVHPSEKLPYNLGAKTKPEAKTNSNNTDSETERDDDEANDIITLHGCGQVTYWPFPQDQKHCPVLRCPAEFGVRSDAIDHYKRRHANYSILCPICVKPVCAQSLRDFRLHYENNHPNKELPYNLNAKHQSQETRKKTDPEMESENDDIDDLITLNGGGYLTQWRFPPNQNQCPMRLCNAVFESRSAAISHYREQHANSSVLCDACNKPIALSKHLGNIRRHYRREHPGRNIPYKYDKGIETSESEVMETTMNIGNKAASETESENDEIDDLIILNGCGYLTQWRFPTNQNQCPMHLCKEVFKSRPAAISHYREQHANHAVLCDVCNKPIAIGRNLSNIINHYKRMHPNAKYPYESGNETEKTEVQTTTNENQKELLCPLKDCTFKLKRIDELREHWNREHSYLRFPEMREESEFSYSTLTSERNVKPSLSSNESNVEPEPRSTSSNAPLTEPSLSSNESNVEPEPRSTSSNAPLTDSESSSALSSSSLPDVPTTELEPSSSSSSKLTSSTTETESPSNDPSIESESSSQEETSSSTVQQDEYDFESDDNLLEPIRSSDVEDSSSTKESSDEDDLNCTECDRSFRSVAGLRKHSMVQHNIHSMRSARKVLKRKRLKSSSSESTSSTNHPVIKKEKIVSDDSDDDNIPITELIKAHTQNDMLLDMQCMVVVERMDATPNVQQAQNLASTETEPEEPQVSQEPQEPQEPQELQEPQEPQEPQELQEPQEPQECRESQESQEDWVPDYGLQIEVRSEQLNGAQEEKVDEKPLDLSIGIRQVIEEDIISISDTEEAPIIISDDSDNETGTELRRSRGDQCQQTNHAKCGTFRCGTDDELTDSTIEIDDNHERILDNSGQPENKESEGHVDLYRQSQSDAKRMVCPVNFPV